MSIVCTYCPHHNRMCSFNALSFVTKLSKPLLERGRRQMGNFCNYHLKMELFAFLRPENLPFKNQPSHPSNIFTFRSFYDSIHRAWPECPSIFSFANRNGVRNLITALFMLCPVHIRHWHKIYCSLLFYGPLKNNEDLLIRVFFFLSRMATSFLSVKIFPLSQKWKCVCSN